MNTTKLASRLRSIAFQLRGEADRSDRLGLQRAALIRSATQLHAAACAIPRGGDPEIAECVLAAGIDQLVAAMAARGVVELEQMVAGR